MILLVGVPLPLLGEAVGARFPVEEALLLEEEVHLLNGCQVVVLAQDSGRSVRGDVGHVPLRFCEESSGGVQPWFKDDMDGVGAVAKRLTPERCGQPRQPVISCSRITMSAVQSRQRAAVGGGHAGPQVFEEVGRTANIGLQCGNSRHGRLLVAP